MNMKRLVDNLRRKASCVETKMSCLTPGEDYTGKGEGATESIAYF